MISEIIGFFATLIFLMLIWDTAKLLKEGLLSIIKKVFYLLITGMMSIGMHYMILQYRAVLLEKPKSKVKHGKQIRDKKTKM